MSNSGAENQSSKVSSDKSGEDSRNVGRRFPKKGLKI